MTTIYACEGSLRTSDMISTLKDIFRMRLVDIRKIIGCDMDTWREFKSRRLTDYECAMAGMSDEYIKLCKLFRHQFEM